MNWNIFTTFSMLFGIGPIVFGLLALLIPIGVPVLVPVGLALPVILGMICSIIVLRLTKQSKLKHKKHRRLAMLGLLGSLLQAYTYIILVSLIFIFKDIEILNDIE